jgi:beta-phosphoglucomutase-like phosphatase (HAD superfamily)
MQALFGVIFDMDGVLVDSGAAHLRAWQQLGTEIGAPFSKELFRRTFGQRNASIIPQWLGQVPPQRLAELEGRKESLYRQFVRQGSVRVFSRIPERLIELRELGVRLAVASSGPRENVALLIDVIGAGNLIGASVASEDVREGKPHPEAFLTAAQRLGVAPAHCAVVEDSVHGIEAAKRAGMLAVAVLTSTPRDQLTAAGADLVVNEVGDLRPQDLAMLRRPPA